MQKIKYNSEDIVSHHGIAAIIKNNKGEILMQEHAKYGFWTIPVGKVGKDQKVVDGLKQEILEECNVQIDEFTEIMTREYTYNRDGNDVLVISHLFDILKYSGEVKNNEPHKHTQQKFLSLDEIKELTYISDLTLLYLETLGFIRSARI